MKATTIRKVFLDFFEGKDHTRCPSSGLVPENDPTLMFTTAGMVQFKPLYAGTHIYIGSQDLKRAVTVQKCLRAGGKGSDLQNVGKTVRHHTFFEMLGNFSFGDYFKEEAIVWAWEFVTQVINLPQDKLFVSVFKDDEEAFKLWEKKIGLNPTKIYKMGDTENFWGPAGNTGACGPCSEIYFDLGEEKSCGKAGCQVGCDCERYLEFWNLVFPQFYQEEDGARRPLKRRGVDTGMGLERLAFILQKLQGKVKNNYETDLFAQLIEEIIKTTSVPYNDKTKFSFYVIADHIRALTFALSENILPSNEGRGYVLRKILRRSLRHARKIGIEKPFLYQLVPAVCQIMQDTYSELKDSREHVSQIIRTEEEKFLSTINRGLAMLEGFIQESKKAKKETISGEQVFILYDTYGFPLDLTEEIAAEENLTIDRTGFEKDMQEQKRRAKESHKTIDTIDIKLTYQQIANKNEGSLQFVGYEKVKSNTKIVAIIAREVEKDELTTLSTAWLKQEASPGDKVELVLEKTPFYAESGGQVGDTGLIYNDKVKIKVTDTQKPLENLYVHHALIEKGILKKGDTVTATVDQERRAEIAKHHTATHLLHYAMRKILGEHIKQAGSLVKANRLRFDFSHFAALSKREIDMIEDTVNQKIRNNEEVEKKTMPLEESKKRGAIALFGDKYGDQVRVVDIGEFSTELCGGTHIKKTGEIGLFKIMAESSIASGIRRIEAICSKEAFQYFRTEDRIIQKLNQLFKTDTPRIISYVEKLLQNAKLKERELATLKEKQAKDNIDEILKKATLLNSIKIVAHNLGEIEPSILRKLGDALKTKIEKGIIVLAGYKAEKVSLITMVTPELVKAGYHAGQLIEEIAQVVEGGGGGKAEMAQAGGKNKEKIDKALAQAIQIIKRKS